MFQFKSWLKNSFFSVALLFLIHQPVDAQIRINEILAINSSMMYDPDFGEFSDYVELYNASSNVVNLKDYTITDNPENPLKWRFPDIKLLPRQYLLLWADGRNKIPGNTAFCQYRNSVITITGLHLGFKLSGDGEYLAIYNAEKRLVDEVYFGVQQSDVSYGRNELNPAIWHYFGDCTPGSRNSNYGATKPMFAPEPIFSVKGGFFEVSQLITISAPQANAQIRFTFDGSTPDHTAPLFTGSFEVFRNFTIKARVYEEGKLPGPVVTHSFFIGENINLPVVSVSTNSEHLWDFNFGLFRNSLKEREIPAVIEYFDQHGKKGFSEGAGVRLFGSTIYNLPQKPMSIRFKSKFGESELNFPLFNNRENIRYKSFLLRNGGNDHNLAFFRDGLATTMIKNQMDLDYQDYKPCVVFVNDQYQGIYDIRERPDEYFIANNHNLSAATLDIIEDSLKVVKGSAADYIQLIDFLQSNDISLDVNYETIASKIDVNEFINYIIHKTFVGYWMFNINNKFWRAQDENGKWRWIASDMEHGFGQLSGDNYWENTLAKVSGQTPVLPEWSTLLFKRLLTNQRFREEFVQRYAVYLNTVYQPETTIAIADSLQNLLASQMPRHINKWKTPVNVAVWEGNVRFIKEFLQNRPAHVRKHIAGLFGFADSALVTINRVGKGSIMVSGVLLNQPFSGHLFRNAHLSIQAIPAAGYRFSGWQGIHETQPQLSVFVTGDTTFTALFEPAHGSIIPPVILRDTVLSASLSPWYAVSDVRVQPGATLTVEAGVEIRMADKASVYVHGGLRVLGTPDMPVTIQPNLSPTGRKPHFNTQPRWGVIAAIDATDTIRIYHAVISGSGFGIDRNKHFSTITALNSPITIDYTSITDNIQPFYSEYSSVYIGNSAFRSQNTCDLINVKYTSQALVENCDLKGNKAPDTDAIDYDGVIGGTIRNNRIYGFWGDNSDGIDLGETSRDLLIEGNIIFNCTDKGISVGQASTALIRRNLIFDCDKGVAVKDHHSFATIDQNTFYANNITIASYEKNNGGGGGNVVVRNTIMAGSLIAPLLVDNQSTLLVSYSLSDTKPLPGTGNLNADPQFMNVATGNFELHHLSPCIDSGDPLSERDPDNSRADMGAYYTHIGSSALTVHINEINYRSPFNYNAGDWIELYNASENTVNIEGWQVKDGSNYFVINIPTKLHPGEYLIVCEDKAPFKTQHPNVSNVLGNLGFELSNKQGQLYVMDADNNPVYTVRYSDTWPWPPLADGKGATLEMEPHSGAIGAGFWRESFLLGGTPGKANSFSPTIEGIYINELMASNKSSIADEHGDFDDWFEIYNHNQTAINIGGLYFTDNITNPRKWQLPLNHPELTTIAPNGFLIIWADDQAEQGPLHASFKLSADGEELGIFRRMRNEFIAVDQVIFGPLANTQTYGRIPDGGKTLTTMHPTPGQPNLRTSIEEPLLPALLVYPNPFSQATTFNTVNLSKPLDIEVSNMNGSQVWKTTNITNHEVVMERGNLQSGVYIYKIISANGQQVTGKLVVY